MTSEVINARDPLSKKFFITQKNEKYPMFSKHLPSKILKRFSLRRGTLLPENLAIINQPEYMVLGQEDSPQE